LGIFHNNGTNIPVNVHLVPNRLVGGLKASIADDDYRLGAYDSATVFNEKEVDVIAAFTVATSTQTWEQFAADDLQFEYATLVITAVGIDNGKVFDTNVILQQVTD
jgi:hypothetical protein